MDSHQVGKYLIVGGVIIAGLGLLIYLVGDRLSWLGRLPGDIRIERDNVSIYIPITTMILLSIALTIILRIIQMLK